MILEVHSDIQTSQMELLAKERFLTVSALNTSLDLFKNYILKTLTDVYVNTRKVMLKLMQTIL